jgi:hypothetical protein
VHSPWLSGVSSCETSASGICSPRVVAGAHSATTFYERRRSIKNCVPKNVNLMKQFRCRRPITLWTFSKSSPCSPIMNRCIPCPPQPGFDCGGFFTASLAGTAAAMRRRRRDAARPEAANRGCAGIRAPAARRRLRRWRQSAPPEPHR